MRVFARQRRGLRLAVATLFAVPAVVGTAGYAMVETAPPADAAKCAGGPFDCQNPNTGCYSTGTTPTQAALYLFSAYVGVVQLRYSTGCRTVWSRIDSEQLSNPAEYYPWTDHSPDNDDTFGLGATPGTDSTGTMIYSDELNDAGYASYAWGEACTQLNNGETAGQQCPYPDPENGDYNAAGPY